MKVLVNGKTYKVSWIHDVVMLAGALVASFRVLLLKALGRIRRWTFLGVDAPPFLVTAGPRALAVALMAATYVVINNSNYLWFGAAAVVIGILCFLSIARFDRLRRLSVVPIPLVGSTGAQLLDKRGNPLSRNVVIGTEEQLRPEAAVALREARRREGGVSLRQFMSGYGSHAVNDPEALWDRRILAGLESELTLSLMHVVLLAVVALFLASMAWACA